MRSALCSCDERERAASEPSREGMRDGRGGVDAVGSSKCLCCATCGTRLRSNLARYAAFLPHRRIDLFSLFFTLSELVCCLLQFSSVSQFFEPVKSARKTPTFVSADYRCVLTIKRKTQNARHARQFSTRCGKIYRQRNGPAWGRRVCGVASTRRLGRWFKREQTEQDEQRDISKSTR